MARARSDLDINMFRAIEVFMAVADMQQMTAAAAALGITQSAASQHIGNLEAALGVRLFDRSSRPMTLTHQGEVLQRHGFRMLNVVEDLRQDLRHLQASSLPMLRIGILASIATTLTPGLFRLVRERLGVPELILSAGLASDHQAALNLRQIDVAITSGQFVAMEGHAAHPVLDEPFLLVLPEDYDGPVDDIDAIAARLSLVRFGADTPVGRRTDQHLQRCRLDLPRAMEADRSSMVVAGVMTGKCFAILTPSLLIDGLAEGMNLRLAPLPFAGFRRGIQVVSRDESLGDIPARLARECALIMQAAVARHMPGFADQVVYHAAANPDH
ncbi:LysR family transcriptional regulator [Paracoccus sp. S-4012]|uniref:LysR family transcriptional regulator n=1 Tax=Paracoccus sp. S-4012 TaxID=2665648 RepID=UPI0012B1090A|nr:LysR family transcriptional regulator [Paracoccus sp. S-4012]MRX49377.1 LysR family transcriptional regulator [Paracoccus sp. S-4012]